MFVSQSYAAFLQVLKNKPKMLSSFAHDQFADKPATNIRFATKTLRIVLVVLYDKKCSVGRYSAKHACI